MPGFQHYVSVHPYPYCRSVNAVAVRVVWANGPAGWGEFSAHEWAELQASCYGNGKIERDSTWTEGRQRQTYRNGERYFYASYRVLMDERNSYVLLQQSTEIRLRMNGNATMETRCNTANADAVMHVVVLLQKWQSWFSTDAKLIQDNRCARKRRRILQIIVNGRLFLMNCWADIFQGARLFETGEKYF